MHSYIDFIVGGGTKAGTSSLYQYLQSHPKVRLTKEGSPHFFGKGVLGNNYLGFDTEFRDFSEYKCSLPTRSGETVIGDFDRLTLHGPNAVELIRLATKAPKIVLILRNPIDRAYSHYLMDVRERFDRRTFADAVDQDYKRLSFGSKDYCGILRLGFYYKQVRALTKAFGRENVMVFLYEDLADDWHFVTESVCRFVGLDFIAVAYGRIPRENVAAAPRSALAEKLLAARYNKLRVFRKYYVRLPRSFRKVIKKCFIVRPLRVEPMEAGVRQVLLSIYKEDISCLAGEIDRDLTHWLLD